MHTKRHSRGYKCGSIASNLTRTELSWEDPEKRSASSTQPSILSALVAGVGPPQKPVLHSDAAPTGKPNSLRRVLGRDPRSTSDSAKFCSHFDNYQAFSFKFARGGCLTSSKITVKDERFQLGALALADLQTFQI